MREIAQAQGVLEDERDGLTRAGHVRRVWDWIKRHEGGAGVGPRLYLGYGTRDRFAKASALLAAHLPPQHVLSIPGGHDWRTWKRLWDAFLQQWGSEGRHTLA